MKSLKEYILESVMKDSENPRKYINKIVDLTSEEDITPLLDEIWEILSNAYKDKGGIKGCNRNKLYQESRMFSIIRGENDEILAVEIFRNSQKGKKIVCGGAINNTEGKLALQSLIIRDIEELDLHHFGEVSGAIEHYFKKHNGYPIPNIYVEHILDNFREGKLLEDGFHYERIIGKDKLPTRKCMFGFPNDEIYNQIMNEFVDYIGFRETVNADTNVNEKKQEYPSNIRKALRIIEFVRECYEEDDLNELFEEMANELKRSLETLENYKVKDEHIDSSIKTCKNLLVKMPIVTLHPIIF